MIRIEYPSIDEASFEGNPVLRGVIDCACLPNLRIDHAYQREFLSPTTRRHILDALTRQQRLPDFELGMRGESWEFAEKGEDVVILKDPVFIIDGQQRRGTILEYLDNNKASNLTVRQGVLVHFNTNMEWERDRFQALNLHQTRVSAPILLRNLRSTNEGIATMYGLTVTDKDFPLRNRVSWGQSRNSKDLLSAHLYLKTSLLLHGHFGGGIISTTVAGTAAGCTRLVEIIGLPNLRGNVKEFWCSIEEVWGISNLNKFGASWLKHGFLTAYANILSDHRDFWNGPKLRVNSDHVSKLKRFPISDPEIRSLCGAGGQAHKTIEFHLTHHLNKNKKDLLDRRADTAYEHRVAAARIVGRSQKSKSNLVQYRAKEPTQGANT